MRGSLALTLTFLDWEPGGDCGPREGWGTGGLGGCDAGGEVGDTEGEVGGGGGAEEGGGGGGGGLDVGGGGGGGLVVDGGGGGGLVADGGGDGGVYVEAGDEDDVEPPSQLVPSGLHVVPNSNCQWMTRCEKEDWKITGITAKIAITAADVTVGRTAQIAITRTSNSARRAATTSIKWAAHCGIIRTCTIFRFTALTYFKAAV